MSFRKKKPWPNIILFEFYKMMTHHKKIRYNMNVSLGDQTSLTALLPAVQTSNAMMVPSKRLFYR